VEYHSTPASLEALLRGLEDLPDDSVGDSAALHLESRVARNDEVSDGLRAHESDYRSAVAADNVKRSIHLAYGICFAT
jgi:hypothetical protein